RDRNVTGVQTCALPILVGGVIEQVAADGAHGRRYSDAPMNGCRQASAARSAEEREADGNDEKGFESFSKGDDESLQHQIGPMDRSEERRVGEECRERR